MRMQIVILHERIIRLSIYGLSNNNRYEVRPGDSTSYARGRYRADRAESPHANPLPARAVGWVEVLESCIGQYGW